MRYSKPNLLYYRITQAAAWLVATFIFKRRILRNEIRGKKGPFVVIANHQAALDFVNLIGATARPMSFVTSDSFFNTLPVKGFMKKIGVIPKQQFQTTVADLKKIKAVIDHGQPVVIYPAGLMCEDGLSTPIPAATYKFLKWLDADVYVARTQGTYFAMPKWSKGFRPGRTYLDIYKLFDREDLADTSLEQVKRKTDEALLFDAYREQETLLVKYKNNHRVSGLENVLYMCPDCRSEFTVQATGKDALRCSCCNVTRRSDAYGFLHKESDAGTELRYVSDWSREIYRTLKQKMERGQERSLTAETKIHVIDYEKRRFVEVGQGTLSLSDDGFLIEGVIHAQPVKMNISVANFPSLPFSPGKYLEVQHGKDIYRCVLNDGKLVMKFINMVKIFYEMDHAQERITV